MQCWVRDGMKREMLVGLDAHSLSRLKEGQRWPPQSSFPVCDRDVGVPVSRRAQFLPLLHHRRYRTLFPHPVPSTGENDVVTRWGMKITGAKVQYLFLPPELRGSYEIMHINNWLRSTLL